MPFLFVPAHALVGSWLNWLLILAASFIARRLLLAGRDEFTLERLHASEDAEGTDPGDVDDGSALDAAATASVEAPAADEEEIIEDEIVAVPSPTRPDPASNGVLFPAGCPWCGDSVYYAEQLICFERKWHKKCFKCIECARTLALGSQLDHDSKPYCKSCHTRSYGPKGFGFGGAVSAATHADADGDGAQAEIICDPVQHQVFADVKARRATLEYAAKGGIPGFGTIPAQPNSVADSENNHTNPQIQSPPRRRSSDFAR
jgi:hypothetical protein